MNTDWRKVVPRLPWEKYQKIFLEMKAQKWSSEEIQQVRGSETKFNLGKLEGLLKGFDENIKKYVLK